MGTRKKPPPSFEDIHAILGGAMRAVPSAEWPQSPHLGGPIPRLDAHQQVGVSLFCALRVSSLVPAADRAAFDEAVVMTRDFYDGKPDPPGRNFVQVADELRLRRARPLWIEVARAMAAGARSVAYGPGSVISNVNKYARDAAVAVVGLVGADFLDELDQELCRRELCVELAGQDLDVVPGRLLYRPRGTGKKPALYLFEESQGLAMLVKLKGRWQIIQGNTDDVLASVPEAYFAGAVDAVRESAFGSRPVELA